MSSAENATNREDHSDERAGRLVKAAHDLLDEAGLDGLTVRAVIARTGLARRAFYERFGGKDDLVLAVFEQTIAAASKDLTNQGAQLDNPMDRLQSIVSGIVIGRARVAPDGAWEKSRVSAALSREHLRLAETRPLELQRALRPLIMVIARELARGMATGQVRETNPDRLAALVYNLVSTTVHAQLLAEEASVPDRKSREMLAEEIWQFCERAIRA